MNKKNIKNTDREESVEGENAVPYEEGMFEHHKIWIDPGQKSMRIDVFLTNMLPNQTRTRIKNAALAGCVRVNKVPVKPSYKVKPGDYVSFLLPHPPASKAQPEKIPLDIIHEDDHILVVNKPAGMVCHPSIGHRTGTLFHGLLYHLNSDQLELSREEQNTPYLVHRIDKDTTGILIIAKTELGHASLTRQFFEHTNDRVYNALVWGNIEEDEGKIEANIARCKKDRKKFCAYEDGSEGKHAVTFYRVLERYGFATLVECRLLTGRTHQIRVHMKHIGHTLFGDYFYGGDQILARPNLPKYTSFIKNCLQTMPRQGLHARTLGIDHPKTGKRVDFDSEWPEDFAAVADKMRRYSAQYQY